MAWATLGAAAAIAAPAAATSTGGALSARLAELARPAVRSEPPARQAAMLGLAAAGPGSLQREGGRVLVDVRYDHGATAGIEALRAAGARILSLSRPLQTVTVAAAPASLRALAAAPGVRAVTEILAPIIYGAGGSAVDSSSSTNCEGGSVISEGVGQLHVGEARQEFALNGSGVTVGALSDSFNTATKEVEGKHLSIATHAAEDEASGDLPGPANPCSGQQTPVRVLEDHASSALEGESTDEGRAMLQTVHDVAPDASLAFMTAYPSEEAFAQNIERLAKPVAAGGAGAQVIADDVAYFEEPFFQDGPVAGAINRVTAAGVEYFTAAGNDNIFDAMGREIASWEAPRFRDSGSCPKALEGIKEAGEPAHCMQFGSSAEKNTFGIAVEAGATLTVDLQWAEPWNGVHTDLDAFLLNSAGEPIKEGGEVVGSYNDNIKSQKPVEVFQWENKNTKEAQVELAINHCFGKPCNEEASETLMPRLKVALLENGGGVSETQYPISSEGDTVGPTILGHSGAASAITVGAERYDTNSAPEPYSSRGPITHYFGPVSGTTPAPALPTPETISKPDLVATDCATTTFFASFEEGVWRYCGTSAAAPHAVGVAALMLQSNPSLTPAQAHAALAASARAVGSFGPNAVGAGLLDAFGAVARVALPPTVTITKQPKKIGRNRSPAVEFSANRPVDFSCSLDGSAPQACSSPFVPAKPLADGQHRFEVTGVDIAGHLGSGSVSFTVETRPPNTFFRQHPRRLIRTHRPRARAGFRFGSNQSPVTFLCRVDGGRFRRCGSRLSRRFALGVHTVRVKARDAAGNVDPTPAVFRFRVMRVS
ncbi:MAG TPA: S8 family serine peptidase [Solirubrobacterales bacterium]|nr:S8 family serine peptidase [Solirubrobacterales bacterium]